MHAKILRLLLDRGADPNLALPSDSSTALIAALRCGNFAAARLLLEGRNHRSRAVSGANQQAEVFTPAELEPVELLLRHGVPQEEKDRALLLAAGAYWLDPVRLLLRYGASANARREIAADSIFRPLPDALVWHRWDLADVLVDGGASVRGCIREKAGQCLPLHSGSELLFTNALLLGAPQDLLAKMLAKGADVNAVGQNGLSAMDVIDGNCARFGRVMTGYRCPEMWDPNSHVDRQEMRRFLLAQGAVQHASWAPLTPAEQAAADPKRGERRKSLASTGVSIGKLQGKVIDSETGAPIADAYVFANWEATASGPVHAYTMCLHSDAARADARGDYAMDAWMGYWAPRFVMAFDRKYRLGAYKAGYDVAGLRGDDILLRPLPAASDHWNFSTIRPCQDDPVEFLRARRNFYGIYATLAADLAPLASEPQRREIVARFQREAQSCLTDYAKPIMRVADTYDMNIDPADSLRPDDLAR